MNPLRAGAIAGVVVIVGTSTAVALAQPQALNMKVADSSVEFGAPVRVSGNAGPELAGRTVALEFAPSGSSTWSSVASAVVAADGAYSIARALPRSGSLRAVVQPAGDGATASSSTASTTAKVAVTHKVGIRTRRLDLKAGSQALVSGRVSPAVRGTTVSLQARRGGRWVALDRARTSASGAFSLRDRVPGPGSADVRVVASAHRGIALGKRGVGRLNVYRVAHASWYGPGFYGRKTGCGGRLGFGQVGVAHKSLPCGTRVTFRHRGRTVTAPVIDRGPYVGNREYDLTAVTAQRLGFRGHGAILTTR
jgi:hypothetical protein